MKTVDVGVLLDAGQWSGHQKFLVGVTALTIVVDGFDNQLLAISILPLMREWDVPRAAFASILASGMIGMMAGGAIGGYVGDRVGRRVALLASVASLWRADRAACRDDDDRVHGAGGRGPSHPAARRLRQARQRVTSLPRQAPARYVPRPHSAQ